ncbi:MAG: DUF6825 family protein [Elainellaceae cyanobacterium]
MSDPLLKAFFVGRAAAEAIGEQVESTVTQALSELGKFDAEQRERLRAFSEQVMEKAVLAEELAARDRPSSDSAASDTEVVSSTPDDLQTVIDELRAEIAQVRVALKTHRES